jgi:spore coat polysaccharide biosynthesis protein SpsF (cytidylyltransferase family)
MGHQDMKPSPRRVAVIQARMSSSRFPGKVLAPLGGLPMIVFMARRVQKAAQLDQVVVATSDHASDHPLAALLAEHGLTCLRGPLDDVLARFRIAAEQTQADHIVRLTGDCPLMDADLIDRGLRELARGECDYVANVLPPSYPDGLDVECFTRMALETAWREAHLPSEREHVTPFMRAGKHGLRAHGWQGAADLSALRWTVDHPDDLEHVASLVAAVGREDFDRFDLLRAIERGAVAPEGAHTRNEGYAKSLADEA